MKRQAVLPETMMIFERQRYTSIEAEADCFFVFSYTTYVPFHGHMMWNWPLPGFMADNHVAMGLAQLLLTTIVMVINQKFFISGFKGLIHKAPNMDTLVALGSTASYGYSVYALFAMTDAQMRMDMDAVMSYMHEFYFESAAMILLLLRLERCWRHVRKERQRMH